MEQGHYTLRPILEMGLEMQSYRKICLQHSNVVRIQPQLNCENWNEDAPGVFIKQVQSELEYVRMKIHNLLHLSKL